MFPYSKTLVQRTFQILVFLYLFLTPIFAFGQSVGVVLSGGGSSGLVHIGVLKALEENQIPINYITGTSMGALIGSLYASGYSPSQLEIMVKQPEFLHAAEGIVNEEFVSYFKQENDNSGWVSWKFSTKNDLLSSIPTNIISPAGMDFELMKYLSTPAAAANYNFDSLFIPYRCVASDVTNKGPVVFSGGNLSQAVRASIAYPFYLKPITINDNLYFDGGLYNNFPIDIMYYEFLPDIIIGSNVSSKVDPPNEDDIVSQIKSLLINRPADKTYCDEAVIIEPRTEASTFDFSDVESIIDSGYVEAMRHMTEIKSKVHRTVSPQALKIQRDAFKAKQKPLEFNSITINGLRKRQATYVKRQISFSKKFDYTIATLEKNYFKMLSDNKIKSVYPIAIFNPNSGKFDLNLTIKKERDIVVDFGGNFSSRPINTGYVGVQYNHLGSTSLSIKANSYFGRLYNSGLIKARLDVPFLVPFYLELEYILNRWNYFKSQSTFFEEDKPSYIIQNENTLTATLGFPVRVRDVVKIGTNFGVLSDEYYQTRTFLKTDTADRTNFNLFTLYALYEFNTLNDKLYPDQGKFFKVKWRNVYGIELHYPGSTSITNKDYRMLHKWNQLQVVYEQYFLKNKKMHLGLKLDGVYADQKLFNNYTASILRAFPYQPTPDSRTLFLESFRANKYIALGTKAIFLLSDNFQFRLEGYLFQAFERVVTWSENTVNLQRGLLNRNSIFSANLLYKTPVGPISVSGNYYYNLPEITLEKKAPFSVMFHFGYIIYNHRALD